MWYFNFFCVFLIIIIFFISYSSLPSILIVGASSGIWPGSGSCGACDGLNEEE
jgi:hypothetical protein